jgi:predicted acyl esterase
MESETDSAAITPTPDPWKGERVEFREGFLVGILIGSGHFGGDGRQPQVTLRMHTRHERLFQWIERNFPGGKVYGPYTHGGRSYYQWMARGAYLKQTILPILERHLDPSLDAKASADFVAMKDRYRLAAAQVDAQAVDAGLGSAVAHPGEVGDGLRREPPTAARLDRAGREARDDEPDPEDDDRRTTPTT